MCIHDQRSAQFWPPFKSRWEKFQLAMLIVSLFIQYIHKRAVVAQDLWFRRVFHQWPQHRVFQATWRHYMTSSYQVAGCTLFKIIPCVCARCSVVAWTLFGGWSDVFRIYYTGSALAYIVPRCCTSLDPRGRTGSVSRSCLFAFRSIVFFCWKPIHSLICC